MTRQDELADLCAAYAEVFKTPSGRIVLRDIEAFCTLTRNTLNTGGAIDPLKQSVLVGRQQVAARIREFAFENPSYIAKKRDIKENNDE